MIEYFSKRNLFDWELYIENNPHLKDTDYAVNKTTAWLHYLKFNYETKSKILPDNYNAELYLELNPDVKNYNNSVEFAIQHYLNYGISENRIYTNEQLNNTTIEKYHDWINLKNSSHIYNLPFTMKKNSFLYYLSAIGSPDLEIKLEILSHNLLYLYNNLNYSYNIIVNIYDDDATQIEKLLNSFTFLNNIFIHHKKGRLVELWKTNPYHNLINNYDYILYNLDDIKIEKMDIHELIDVKNKYSIEFLSPKVLYATHPYMYNQNDNILAFANKIEIYTLLLTSTDFFKFMDINDIENTHTWGIDLVLGYFNIKSAIYFKFDVSHQLVSNTNKDIADFQMQNYLKKFEIDYYTITNEIYPIFNECIEI